MTPAQHALFIACVAVAGYVQNLTGFAFGLVLLGLVGLLHAAPLTDVAHVVSFLTLVNAVVLFRTARPELERAVMAPTLAGSLAGVLVGVALLNWLSDNVVTGLRLLLGVTIVACAAVLVMRAGERRERSPASAFGAIGLVSGVLGGLFSTAGPPLVYHFYRQPMAPRAIRDALVTIFAANAVLRIGTMVATGRMTWSAVWLAAEAVPVVMAQTWWMQRRALPWAIDTVRRVVAVLLAIVGVSLAGPSAWSLWSGLAR